MRDGPLVSVDWLAARLGTRGLIVADVRWYLKGKTGRQEYDNGHIPGARFVDIDGDLADPPGPGKPGRHPLPSVEHFGDVLARLGVTPSTTVVAYDDAGGSVAARLWWMLRWVGHAGGRVLDGGIQEWTRTGHALSTEPSEPEPAPAMKLSARGELVASAEDVERLRHRGALILDARAAERYSGAVEPIDPRAGHVPGARSAPFVGNLVEPGGRFRSAEELARYYRALGVVDAPTTVAYCGSGVNACHTLLALSIVGQDALLYEGSWSDWSSDSARPAATGHPPSGRVG